MPIPFSSSFNSSASDGDSGGGGGSSKVGWPSLSQDGDNRVGVGGTGRTGRTERTPLHPTDGNFKRPRLSQGSRVTSSSSSSNAYSTGDGGGGITLTGPAPVVVSSDVVGTGDFTGPFAGIGSTSSSTSSSRSGSSGGGGFDISNMIKMGGYRVKLNNTSGYSKTGRRSGFLNRSAGSGSGGTGKLDGSTEYVK